MSRLVPILCAACLVGIGLTAWSQLSAGNTTVVIPKGGPAPKKAAATETAEQLRKARMACSVAALDRCIEAFQAQVAAKPDKAVWHHLAEAYLERALTPTHLRGMAPGEPTFEELPTDFAGDLKAGLEAVAKARELGDETGELFRIEAGLMSQLGNDPEKALEHFEFADKADGDERPAVFAAMANYLQSKRQKAIAWLERAVEKNPDNKFARVVLGRVRRGEDNPFGRNVTEEEVAAGK